MLSLEVGTSILDAPSNKSTVVIRKLFRLLDDHHHDHEQHHSPRGGPLADYIDIDENDHHDYRPYLSMKNKRIFETHRKERQRGVFSNGEHMSSRRDRKQDRALALNAIYFQQLGKYHNDTAPPSPRTASRNNQHHGAKMTAKTKSLRTKKTKTSTTKKTKTL